MSVQHRLAQVLSARARPGDLVAAQEVGNLAYWTDLPVLDLLGLTSPEVTPLNARTKGNLSFVLLHSKPKYVVANSREEFWQTTYHVVHAEHPGGAPYRIWQRNTPEASYWGRDFKQRCE